MVSTLRFLFLLSHCLVIFSLAYGQILSVSELRNHDTKGLISAHRGGKYDAYPENSLEVFAHTLKSGVTIFECDIQITADDRLVLLHDEMLDRTTSSSGNVREVSLADIQNLRLKDQQGRLTDVTLPTLDQALDWSVGRGILMLDVKRNVPFELVLRLVKEKAAKDRVVIIVYNFADAQKVYRLDHEITMSVSIQSHDDLDRFLQTGIPPDRVVAFTGVVHKPDLYPEIHKLGIPCILGTMNNLDRRAAVKGDGFYLQLLGEGVDILATDRPIEAYSIIYADQ